MEPIQFAIVGGGWRAGAFLQIARAMPARFAVTGVLVAMCPPGFFKIFWSSVCLQNLIRAAYSERLFLGRNGIRQRAESSERPGPPVCTF